MAKILRITLFCIFSNLVYAQESVTDITSKILQMNSPQDGLSDFYQTDKVTYFVDAIDQYGEITDHECSQNHDSPLFNTVACFVKYSHLKSGLVWEFYFFKENEKWIGTNLGVIQEIPNEVCIADITFKKQLGQGITYEQVPCM
ncbi:hypothetical protein [Alteromonas sp. KUL49]|uniref:hypothetical protein n=1 Tax=Alteromonas sp. KUL49 TaxID=2480798 RepID=UPI00102EDF05|nr:hypothetical protein [Alteromonas sp. KUL49]TAP42622.1 hypothetical protein EYS00_03150 [Alteromonas sp. KUL49]